MTGLVVLLKPALLARDGLCSHQPRCPGALVPDRSAARSVARRPEQGRSLLCNGVVFDDGGQLLPDGRAISPPATCTRADLPQHAAEPAAAQSRTAAAAPRGCDEPAVGGVVLAGMGP